MKKQLKKSLSLFLAVLMLMSCWVWVAPTEAQAADGDYPVTIGYSISDRQANGGTFRVRIYYVANNGTASSTSVKDYTWSLETQTSGEANVDRFLHSMDVPGFPVFFEVQVSVNKTDEHSLFWDYVSIGTSGNLLEYDTSLCYTFNNKSGSSDEKGFYLPGYDPNSGKTESGDTLVPASYDMPKIVKVDNPVITGFSMTLNKVGGADVTGTGNWKAGTNTVFTDQYGVKWIASDTSSFASLSKTGYIAKAAGDEKEVQYLYNNTNTLTFGGSTTYNASTGVNISAKASANLQRAEYGINSLSAYAIEKYTATYSFGSGKNVTQEFLISIPFTVNYPPYTVTFDGDGVTPASPAAQIEIKNGTSPVANDFSASATYGSSLASYPTGNVTKSNHVFYGFWTEKQPSATTENASPYVAEASFAEPVDSTTFTNYGGTSSSKYVTYNNKQYYNAGTRWDPEKRDVDGEKTYYGWWLSEDVTLKFYDVDGSYLDTVYTKYGKTGADITWPTPKESFENGAYTYSNFNGTWGSPKGDILTQTSSTIFTEDLVLTPRYDTVSFDNSYAVSFINPSSGNSINIGGTEFKYRENLSTSTNGNGKVYLDVANNLVSVPTAISMNDDYSYTFVGWSSTAPASGNYHIMLEEGGYDVNGKPLSVNDDWIVRADTTYYAVFQRAVRSYVVSYKYTNANGAEVTKQAVINYGDLLTVPTEEYDIPYEYAKEGYGYTFKAWNYTDASKATATFGFNDSLVFNNTTFNLPTSAWNDGDAVTPIEIYSSYYDGVPTPYTVTFNYLDEDGEAASKTVQVNHGKYIEQSTVDTLNNTVSEFADNGDTVYKFTGLWTYDESDYATGDLTSFSPVAHTTFTAKYEYSNEYYDVTYIDGSKTATYKVLGGSTLPAFTQADVEYIPENWETEKGVYEFQGWFDEKQTDTEYKQTNGTKYTAESTVDSDLTLYPQYKFIPTTYDFYFYDHNGVQIGAAKLEYGQDLSMYEVLARKAAQGRPADDTYTYEFIGWDKEVPAFCEGESMDFYALYKSTYIYYELQWYNSKLVDGKWVIDETEAALLGTTHTTYGGKIYAPAITLVCPETAPAGQNYVTTGWYYIDAEGNEQKYVRGMLLDNTDGYKLYPKYELTAAPQTVTTVVTETIDGVTTTVETVYTVANGAKADMIPNPAEGYVDATYHRAFDGWYTTESFDEGTEFDLAATAITANIKLYAKFTTEAHNFAMTEIVEYPTYYKVGTLKTWCECSKAYTEKTTEIAKLVDDVAPTGTIYLGANRWSSDGEPASATDGDPVTIYANKDTDIILTVNDTAKVTTYNPSGDGKGIKMIRGFISEGVYSQDNQAGAVTEVKTIYEDTSEELNNTVNYVIKLGEYEGLEDGKTYIGYYYVIDKAGNVLNTNVRTAKFIYDTTAPSFEVIGASNAHKSHIPTYCGEATIHGIEEGATLTVNGETKSIIWGESNGVVTGVYPINTADNYFVTVTDRAGNKTSKMFIVADGHDYITKEVKSTCETAGYKQEICSYCEDVKSDITYPATDHVWTQDIINPTCTENGYIIRTCTNCGKVEKVEFEEDGVTPLYPAAGHEYAKDESGNIIYTIETAPTCVDKGKEVAKCLYCNEKLEREVDVNPDAHKYGAIKTVKATCTEAGYKYQTCKYCYKVNIVEAIAALGHTYDASNDDHYEVTVEATCGTAGTKTLKCQVCETTITDAEGNAITKEIPATNRHIIYVKERIEATTETAGKIIYGCQYCDYTKEEALDKISTYTVTFLNEDGTEYKKITGVVSGTTITATDVPNPVKAATAEEEYTFAYWVDADNKDYTLPIDVTSDLTLTAVFTSKKILYTHKFQVPTTYGSDIVAVDGEEATATFGGYETLSTLIGVVGDEKVPAATPTLKATALHSFTFIGWSTREGNADYIVGATHPEGITDFKVSGHATFYAIFEVVPVVYEVIFYNGTEFLWKATVKGGEGVTYGGETPVKAYDANNHYVFSGWDKDFTNITATTRVYAQFDTIAHAYDKANGTVIQNADCTLPELTQYACSCGHKITEETRSALSHDLGEYVYDEETGCNVATCKRDNCDYTHSIKASFTVKFENEDGLRLATYTVKNNGSVAYDFETYAAPTKASTAQYDYTFAGWVDADGNEYEKDHTFTNIAADTTFTAYYTEVVRYYTVSYVTSANKVLQTASIKYGDPVPAYAGATDSATIPVPKFTNDVHYIFDKWEVEAGTIVVKELVIKPVFKAEAHVEVESSSSEATCTQAGGRGVKCAMDCGYAYTDGSVPATGHNFKVTRVEPDYDAGIDGYISYVCQNANCDHADDYTTVLSSALIDVVVNVKDSNGNPKQGVEVSLVYADQPNKAVDGTHTLTTGADGKVVFKVKPGEYLAKIGSEYIDITVDSDRNVTGGDYADAPEVNEDPSCKCSCHRDGFWGIIFRFFHKIIAFFTGGVNCCSCPDGRY